MKTSLLVKKLLGVSAVIVLTYGMKTLAGGAGLAARPARVCAELSTQLTNRCCAASSNSACRALESAFRNGGCGALPGVEEACGPSLASLPTLKA